MVWCNAAYCDANHNPGDDAASATAQIMGEKISLTGDSDRGKKRRRPTAKPATARCRFLVESANAVRPEFRTNDEHHAWEEITSPFFSRPEPILVSDVRRDRRRLRLHFLEPLGQPLKPLFNRVPL